MRLLSLQEHACTPPACRIDPPRNKEVKKGRQQYEDFPMAHKTFLAMCGAMQVTHPMGMRKGGADAHNEGQAAPLAIAARGANRGMSFVCGLIAAH